MNAQKGLDRDCSKSARGRWAAVAKNLFRRKEIHKRAFKVGGSVRSHFLTLSLMNTKGVARALRRPVMFSQAAL